MPFASKAHTALISAFLLLGIAVVDGGAGTHLLTPTIAQAADNITLEDISFEGDAMTLDIPRAIVNGTSLTQTELEAIFDSESKKPLAERLSALTAASIIIPELILTQEEGDTTQIVTYYNVELRDINKGVIGKASSARSSILGTIDEEDEEFEVLAGSVGSTSVEAIDTVFAARLFNEASTSEPRKTQMIHGPFSVNDYRVVIAADEEDEDDGLTVSIKNIKGDSLSARLGHSPLSTIFGLSGTTDEDFEKLPVAKKRAVLIGMSDLLSSFDIGATTFNDIMITDGQEDSSKSKYVVRVGSIGTQYIDQQLRLTLDDISFNGKSEKEKDNVVTIKHFGLEDLSFKTTIAGLDAAAKSDLEKNKSPLDSVTFAPTGGKLAIENVNVDFDISSKIAEDDKSKDISATSLVPSAPQRLTLSLKAFNTTLGSDLSHGVANFQTTLSDLHLPLATLSDMDGVKELREMGYTDLTLSSAFKGQWDEAKNQVTIDTFSFSGQDIGSINASARFGDVKKEALSTDIGAVFSALDQASLHEVSLTLENGGLFERVVKQQSKDGAGTEEEIKQQYAALATVGIPAIIGDTPVARKLATAVSRFANSPRKLSITAKAKDPKGIPVKSLDLENTEPKALLERFDITTSE